MKIWRTLRNWLQRRGALAKFYNLEFRCYSLSYLSLSFNNLFLLSLTQLALVLTSTFKIKIITAEWKVYTKNHIRETLNLSACADSSTRHLSHLTWPTPTATVTDPPPTNSSTMQSSRFAKNPKPKTQSQKPKAKNPNQCQSIWYDWFSVKILRCTVHVYAGLKMV